MAKYILTDHYSDENKMKCKCDYTWCYCLDEEGKKELKEWFDKLPRKEVKE